MPPSRRDVFDSVSALVQEIIDSLFSDASHLHAIHNDLHRWNAKMADNRAHPFDFEWVVRGHPLQDIAATFFYVQRRRDYAALRDAFFKGYTRHRVWPEQEEGQTDVLVAGRFLYLLSWGAQEPGLREGASGVAAAQEPLLRKFLQTRREGRKN
jgi:Ser/Thr protein kinase RdoA (MazF antagonist)